MFRLAMPLLLIGVAVATGGATDQRQSAAERAQAKIAHALEGMTAGAPRDCIPRERMGEARQFPDTILYVEGRKRVWRNDVVGHCAGLGQDDLMVVTSPTGQLCRGDLITTRARVGGMITGSCSLGRFVPYSK